jgi:thiosulfate/3-mercaptopyruvate sulfurtransferase
MKNLAANPFCALFGVLLLFLVLTACEQSSIPEPGLSPEELSVLQEQREHVLISSEWLADYGHYPDLHILELGRTPYEYAQAHIPEAKFIDWRVDITNPAQPDKYNILPRAQFEALMGKLGITLNSTVVLYDTLDNRASARMFWTMKYYMHESVKVLDGGLTAWQRAGYELSAEPPEIVQTQYLVESVRGTLLVDMQYVLGNVSDPNHSLVDGRPFEQYTGEIEGKVYNTGSTHQRLGHIYGAHSVPWASNLNEDGTFKSTQELLALYEVHEVTRDKTVVTYCNEGLHAAMPWFVLSELLGYQDVRLYDSSMAEWANLSETPMITGEHCM